MAVVLGPSCAAEECNKTGRQVQNRCDWDRTLHKDWNERVVDASDAAGVELVVVDIRRYVRML